VLKTPGNYSGANTNFKTFSAVEAIDGDLNDRESFSAGENPSTNFAPKAIGSAGSYDEDRYSRRLYVITEESQSMAGAQTIDM